MTPTPPPNSPTPSTAHCSSAPPDCADGSGPGSNRMNRVVVARAAAGLAAYLRGAVAERSVVIGYDARRNSDVFARDTARIMAGAGITAMVLPTALPTPVLAFAIRELGCDAGVMVTASHNPPDDNGYKVYLGDGSQIVPPADARDLRLHRRGGSAGRSIPQSDDYRTLDDAVLDAYVARAVSLLGDGPREVSAVYTAMHGVGGEVFMRAVGRRRLRRADHGGGAVRPRRPLPDGELPQPRGTRRDGSVTGRRPGAGGRRDHRQRSRRRPVRGRNPLRRRLPDAHRRRGGRTARAGGSPNAAVATVSRPRGVYAQSIVSGTLLERIADDAGLGYATTLTGFKWISQGARSAVRLRGGARATAATRRRSRTRTASPPRC